MPDPDELRRAGDLLAAELERRGCVTSVGGTVDMLAVLRPDGARGEVALDNLARSLAAGDAEAVRRFADAVTDEPALPLDWATAATRIHFVPEHAGLAAGDAIVEPVSAALSRVLAYVDADRIRLLSPADLQHWGVSREIAASAAADNLDRLLAATDIELAGESRTVGMLSTESSLKAALIFARGLRSRVEPQLGWPVMAVVPDRDFVYLIARSDLDRLLPGLATIVVREFTTAPAPVSNELFEIDDDGVRAVGAFEVPAG